MRIRINDVKEGMELSNSVYHGHSILIEEETRLTKELIEKLKKFNIIEIEIKEDSKEKLKEVLKQEALLKDAFDSDFQSAVEETKEIINSIASGEINEETLEEIIDDSLSNIDLDSNIIISLLGGESNDNYIYKHSMSTAIMSLVIGKALGYNEEKLSLLGKGAILHDVGMLKIDTNIIEKKDKLNEKEIKEIRKHIEYGAQVVSDYGKEVEEIVKYHHERMDGSGYPEGLKGKEIPEMARIVAIADVYTALIENRSYRNKYDFYDAMKILMQSSANLLDPEILKLFLAYMPLYPINAEVKLSDGRLGKVKRANNNPFRPIVDVEEEGEIVRIDLSSDEYAKLYVIRMDTNV